MLRHVQRECGLAHRRPGRQDEQFAGMKATRHLIELRKTGADSLNAFARIEESIKTTLKLLNDLRGIRQCIASARFAEAQELLFRAGENLIGSVFLQNAAIDEFLRRENNAPQQ